MKSLVKTVTKVIKCCDGSEKWFFNDGTYEIMSAEWLKYAERARAQEQKEWKKMMEKIHLRTGRSVA